MLPAQATRSSGEGDVVEAATAPLVTPAEAGPAVPSTATAANTTERDSDHCRTDRPLQHVPASTLFRTDYVCVVDVLLRYCSRDTVRKSMALHAGRKEWPLAYAAARRFDERVAAVVSSSRARHRQAKGEKDGKRRYARDEAPATNDDTGVVAAERLDSLAHQVWRHHGAYANRCSGDSLQYRLQGANQVQSPEPVHRGRVSLDLGRQACGPRQIWKRRDKEEPSDRDVGDHET